ncbi:hypothetical protein Tco_0768324 [Tanacetum coccineum]
MIEANIPECSTKNETKDVASHIAATNIVVPQTEDDSDDEVFSSSSAELVTCIPISMKKSFSDEVEDDIDKEAEDDKNDSDDETWSPKTIGTTSKNIISPNKKGATSSSSKALHHWGKAASGDQAAVPANFELLSWKVVSNVTDDKRVFKQILKEGEGHYMMELQSSRKTISSLIKVIEKVVMIVITLPTKKRTDVGMVRRRPKLLNSLLYTKPASSLLNKSIDAVILSMEKFINKLTTDTSSLSKENIELKDDNANLKEELLNLHTKVAKKSRMDMNVNSRNKGVDKGNEFFHGKYDDIDALIENVKSGA